MDFALSPEQRTLYDQTVAFAKSELSGNAVERDRQGEFPRQLWQRCGAQRLQGMAVPEALGGRGLDPLSSALVMEALGYGCDDSGLVFSLGAHLTTVAIPVWKYGSAEQKERYLRGLCDGSLVAVGALTEPATGSDAFALQTTAKPDSGGFVLNGTKRYITNTPFANLISLYAVTDPEKGFHGGITTFLLETDREGLRFGPRLSTMGLRSSPLGEIVLSDVRVPATAVLGQVGGGGSIFASSMDWERTLLMAANVGTMQRLLERGVQYSRTRRQGGTPIGKHQAVSHRLADIKISLEAARLLVYRSAWNLERSRSVSLDAAIAKAFTSEAYLRAATDMVRTHGAHGYLTGTGLERAVRDALGATIASGTTDIQKNIIARWLGL